jgi:nucleoid DNA-binding protein
MKRDHTTEIIDQIILETGYGRKNVEAIVNSFLGIYQDKISDDGVVFLKGFGEMKAVMRQRKYYDINQRKTDQSTPRPSVKFKPTIAFLNLIKQSQGSNVSKEGGR